MSSSRVGSVFLGDLQRHRHLASPTHSTPPSSPPATIVSGVFPGAGRSQPSSPSFGLDIDMDPAETAAVATHQSPDRSKKRLSSSGLNTTPPAPIDPVLALELRLRWLEALILGVKQDVGKDRKGKGKEDYATTSVAAAVAAVNLKPDDTLVRLTETVQQRLSKSVEGNEGLRRFMNNYDQHAHLLTSSFALSGLLPDPPTYGSLSAEETNTLLVEMEPDIRAADRDMREIEILEKKGVTGAGKLPEYERLEPRLKALIEAHQEDLRLAASLEERIASLINHHALYVDHLSALFVAWDDAITEAEDKLAGMEREKGERLRLGLE